jgi:TRAP-type mannitol/chloroaromatic compound transport system permease small subunit
MVEFSYWFILFLVACMLNTFTDFYVRVEIVYHDFAQRIQHIISQHSAFYVGT